MSLPFLKQEEIITPASSLEKTLSEEEIDGDVLIHICRGGVPSLRACDFKAGPAFRLEQMYLRLLKEEKEEKRPKSSKEHLQKYRIV